MTKSPNSDKPTPESAADTGPERGDARARDQSHDALIDAANAARERAYAPYSEYQVGCVLVADGRHYRGANIENASYGLCLCAERTALAAAVMDGVRHLDVVVVTTSSQPPAPPCGMCLQALMEFSRDPNATQVILANQRGQRRVLTLAALLPHSFSQRELSAAAEGAESAVESTVQSGAEPGDERA
ncbi:MAG: hypothetical protein Tsb0020_14630 [Haliangiales bacterium]